RASCGIPSTKRWREIWPSGLRRLWSAEIRTVSFLTTTLGGRWENWGTESSFGGVPLSRGPQAMANVWRRTQPAAPPPSARYATRVYRASYQGRARSLAQGADGTAGIGG